MDMLWIPVVIFGVLVALVWVGRFWSVRREKDPVEREHKRQALYFNRGRDGKKLSSKGTDNTSGYG